MASAYVANYLVDYPQYFFTNMSLMLYRCLYKCQPSFEIVSEELLNQKNNPTDTFRADKWSSFKKGARVGPSPVGFLPWEEGLKTGPCRDSGAFAFHFNLAQYTPRTDFFQLYP